MDELDAASEVSESRSCRLHRRSRIMSGTAAGENPPWTGEQSI